MDLSMMDVVRMVLLLELEILWLLLSIMVGVVDVVASMVTLEFES